MKAILLFALLVAAVVARSDQETHQAWRDFTTTYQKTYPGHEAVRRFKVFKSNVEYIDRVNAMNLSYQLGVNQFADLTSAEYTKMLGFRGTMEDHLVGQPKDPKTVPIPQEFDWRTKGVVTGVKNQEQCGSCWAFSTTGSTEGCHALTTGKLVSLSEKNLMDCSVPEGNQGCNGGLMTQAMEYIIKNHGVDTEASYPYVAQDGKCHFNASNIGATLKSYENVPTGDEKQLLSFATHGPVSVAIDASHQSFQMYKSGVYYEPSCSSSQLDHGVLVVGWGVENGKDYFLVKNSWGPAWGLEGYIKMSRNHNNNCGIATAATLPKC